MLFLRPLLFIFAILPIAISSFAAGNSLDEELYDPEYVIFKGPLEVREIEGKGRGLFATAPISPGEVVLVERPFLKGRLSKAGLCQRIKDDSLSESIYQKLELLFPYELSKTYGFRNKRTFQVYLVGETGKFIEDATLYGEKISKNAFQLNDKEDGIILYGSMINHSCELNTVYGYHNGNIVFVASEDIEAGEELLTSYFDCIDVDTSLKASLNYGFRCRGTYCQSSMVDNGVLRFDVPGFDELKYLEHKEKMKRGVGLLRQTFLDFAY